MFKQNTLIQIHAISEPKTQSFQILRPSPAEFFWFYVKEQSILDEGTVENFSKNFFNEKLQLFIYKKNAKIRQNL